MDLAGAVAVITGAASGIGRELAEGLRARGARGLALVDRGEGAEELARELNERAGKPVARAFLGDVVSDEFRVRVFQEVREHFGTPNLCVPAAGVAQGNHLAVRMDKESSRAALYPREIFDQTLAVNLTAATYWGMELVAAVAEARQRLGLGRWLTTDAEEGVVVFIGSIFSRGARGQLAYAVSKGGIEAAAGTLRKEAIYFGVRCACIHPGFVDTPMVRAMGDDFVKERILPATRLGRLIRPAEIVDAILALVTNPALASTLWADAGWTDPG